MLMRRPGPLIVDASATNAGASLSENRLRDYNENHAENGQFTSGEGPSAAKGNAANSSLGPKFKYSPAFWPTTSEHVAHIAAATTAQEMSNQLAALEKNKNLTTEHLGKIVSRYTLKDPVSNTRSGLIKEIGAHYEKVGAPRIAAELKKWKT